MDNKTPKSSIRIDTDKLLLLQEKICPARGGLKKAPMINVLIQEEYDRLVERGKIREEDDK